MHYILKKAVTIEDWKEIIEIILKNQPEIFYTPNSLNEIPNVIDWERRFGISKLLDEIKETQETIIQDEVKKENLQKVETEIKQQK